MRRGAGIFLFIALSLAAACNIWNGPQDTDELPPAAAPTGLKLISVSGKTALSWDDVAGATRYSIYRSENDGPYTRVASFTPPPASWTIPDTGGAEDYRYRVSVTTASGSESSLSQALSLKTWQPAARILVESSNAYITWNSVANAADYRVYQYSGSDPDNGTFDPLPGTISSDSSGTVFRYDTPVTLSPTYYYKVVTINFDGNEGTSSAYICTVPRNGKVLFSSTKKSLTLSWDMVPGARAYNLYRDTNHNPYPSSLIVADIVLNEYEDKDTSLTPGTPYYYQVAAVFPDGVGSHESPESPEFSGFTLPASPAVSAAFNLSEKQVTLSWTPVPLPSPLSAEISYNIYYSKNGTGQYTLINQQPYQSSISYTHTAVDPEIRHFYKVFTVHNEGEIDSGTLISSPPSPTGISATPVSGSNIGLSWGPVPGATLYKIYHSTDGTAYALEDEDTAPTYSHAETPAMTHYYRISTVIGTFEGPRSQPVSTPNAPAGIKATPYSDTIELNWASEPGAASYNIYSSPNGVTYTLLGSPTPPTALSYPDPGLNPAEPHYYKISTVIAGFEGAQSQRVLVPRAPASASIMATPVSSSSIALNWSLVSDATSYKIYHSIDGTTYTLLGSSTSPAYTHTGLSTATTHHYKISSVISIVSNDEVVSSTEGLQSPSVSAVTLP
ncbi:MAG: hypothetical protein LBK13_06455 [Spirochaetales bacterium]|jgi:fibronectin type 3 domain-containing protein|nr:hypothetical protein [Spirochaetales bacterium]